MQEKLLESLLVSFLDEKANYVIHFFDGQKLIADMSVIHQKSQGHNFSYFRDCILAAQPMISFLKPGESLGLYIDNENPFFRFKLETGSNGLSRFLLLPSDFEASPDQLLGRARLTKQFQSTMSPYTSIIEINGLRFLEVINKILRESYQVDSIVVLSETTDQSLMLSRLPMSSNPLLTQQLDLDSYKNQNYEIFQNIFRANLSGEESYKEYIKNNVPQWSFLQSKPVKYYCPCKKQKFITSLLGLHKDHLEEMFPTGENEITVTCDYCHKAYQIHRSELAPLQ